MTEESSHIELKTDNEQRLYKAYREERTVRKELEQKVNALQATIEELQQQIQQVMELKNSKNNEKENVEESSSMRVEYHTDEEELAKETEWIRQRSRKKRKLNMNTSLTPPQQQEQQKDQQQKQKVKKTPMPPPIIVDGIQDYQKFYDFLMECQQKDSFTIKVLNGNSVKVNASAEDSYKSITKQLRENDCLWHSYENKQERPIRVMAKRLPSSCKPDRIIEDLKSNGYKIENAVNKLSWKNKERLNMFVLTFSNDEEIKKIYDIQFILGCKIEIHPLKTPKLIPQCKRCQAYGHTQKYCSKEPRCVKCTGKHLTVDCKKPAAEKAKCVHCGEPHPANYRGCAVAKELQKIKNTRATKSPTEQKQQINKDQKHIDTNMTSLKALPKNADRLEQKSYAQAAKNTIKTDSLDCKLNEILRYISSFDERLKKLENSTKQAKAKSIK